MKTIYKYTMDLIRNKSENDIWELKIPQMSKIIKIKMLKPNVITFWVQIEKDWLTSPYQKVKIKVAGTGHDIPENDYIYFYIDSVFDPQRTLVWHVYHAQPKQGPG